MGLIQNLINSGCPGPKHDTSTTLFSDQDKVFTFLLKQNTSITAITNKAFRYLKVSQGSFGNYYIDLLHCCLGISEVLENNFLYVSNHFKLNSGVGLPHPADLDQQIFIFASFFIASPFAVDQQIKIVSLQWHITCNSGVIKINHCS